MMTNQEIGLSTLLEVCDTDEAESLCLAMAALLDASDGSIATKAIAIANMLGPAAATLLTAGGTEADEAMLLDGLRSAALIAIEAAPAQLLEDSE